MDDVFRFRRSNPSRFPFFHSSRLRQSWKVQGIKVVLLIFITFPSPQSGSRERPFEPSDFWLLASPFFRLSPDFASMTCDDSRWHGKAAGCYFPVLNRLVFPSKVILYNKSENPSKISPTPLFFIPPPVHLQGTRYVRGDQDERFRFLRLLPRARHPFLFWKSHFSVRRQSF